MLRCQARNFSSDYFLNMDISHWPRDFSTCRKCRRWGFGPRCLVGSTRHTMPLLCSAVCEGKRGMLISFTLCWSQDGLEPTCLPDTGDWKEKLCPLEVERKSRYTLSAQPPPLIRPLCLLYILLDLEPGRRNADSVKREETWRANAASKMKWLQLILAFPFLSSPSALFSEKESGEL